jgi:hypothetical protein
LRPCLENTHHKEGLAKWLKVNALSSSLSTAKKKKEKKKEIYSSHNISISGEQEFLFYCHLEMEKNGEGCWGVERGGPNNVYTCE